jgi:hypothetical protein
VRETYGKATWSPIWNMPRVSMHMQCRPLDECSGLLVQLQHFFRHHSTDVPPFLV